MAVSNNSMILIMLVVVAVLFSTPAQSAHNITEILSGFPDYSVYNDYLTKTKVSDEINSRQTITVLVLNNGAMSSLTADNHPLSVIKKALSLLVLLDYFDAQKLHDISEGTTLSTTLYQTSGTAPGNLGFVNITDLKGGKVAFGSAAPGSKLDSSYTKSVKQIPYSLSVLEISAPVIAPGILTAPAASAVNITALLEKAGCKTFSSMLISTGVLKMYESSALDKGLTLFAPNDEAFKKEGGSPDLTKLSSAEIVTMLQYHALPSYTPIGTLKTSKGHPISTLATNGAKKFELSVTTAGDSVTLNTGVDSSRVAGTVIDETPLCIFTVDDVLLPIELFGNGTAAPSPSPTLAPEPSASDAPSSAPTPEASDSPSSAPAPAPESADSPSPASGPSPFASPPAPASGSSPNGSPADSPGSDSDTSADGKNHGVLVHVSIFKTLICAGALLAWNL